MGITITITVNIRISIAITILNLDLWIRLQGLRGRLVRECYRLDESRHSAEGLLQPTMLSMDSHSCGWWMPVTTRTLPAPAALE